MRVKHIYKIEIKDTASGQKTELWLPQIDDLILIKRSDLMRYFNVASSTLDAAFQSGQLKKYQANGMHKAAGDKSGCYYNLSEFLSMNEEAQSKPVRRLPSTFTLNLRSNENSGRGKRKAAATP